MLATVLILTVVNTLLQTIAVYQRHEALQLQKRNGTVSS